MNKPRFAEIDLLRSFAIIGMIIFHLYFILNFYEIATYDTKSGYLAILGHFVRNTFITLVGVSLAISSKGPSSIKRKALSGLKILVIAYLITLVTYLFIPENFVKFGILHMIGLGIIFFSPIAHKKFINLSLSVILISLWLSITQTPPIQSNNYLIYISGIEIIQEFEAVDHFPILPWFSLISLGIYIGHILKNHQLKNLKIPKILTYLSKKSLLIYIVHIPAIILILIISGQLSLNAL